MPPSVCVCVSVLCCVVLCVAVFLRDLPYDCRAAAVSSALAAFGPLSQAAVLVPNKGSAFAKFRDRSAVERCLAAARAGAGGISVDGRCCRVDLAVDRSGYHSGWATARHLTRLSVCLCVLLVPQTDCPAAGAGPAAQGQEELVPRRGGGGRPNPNGSRRRP